MVNVGKYTSPMDAMGDVQSPPFGSQYVETTFSKHHDLLIEKSKQLIWAHSFPVFDVS